MTIASEIQNQFGRKALFMVGAHNLIAHPNAFSFRFKGCKTANYCKITLDEGLDLYSIELQKVGRAPAFKCTEVFSCDGMYADQLHAVIEGKTGLYLSL